MRSIASPIRTAVVTGLSTNPLDGFAAGTFACCWRSCQRRCYRQRPDRAEPDGLSKRRIAVAISGAFRTRSAIRVPESRTWQAINTTTWKANDSLTVKGILSYGEFRGDTTLDLFGLYNPSAVPDHQTNAGSFANSQRRYSARLPSATLQRRALPDRSAHQRRIVVCRGTPVPGPWREVQLAGRFLPGEQQPARQIRHLWPFANALRPDWQRSADRSCGKQTMIQTDAGQICLATANQANSLGRVGLSLTENYFRDKAIYWQGILELTDQLKFTAGIRYTWDEMRSDFQVINLRYYTSAAGSTTQQSALPLARAGVFEHCPQLALTAESASSDTARTPAFAQGVGFCDNNVAFGIRDEHCRLVAINASMPGSAGKCLFPGCRCSTISCKESHTVKTSAPTWLLGLDFKPMRQHPALRKILARISSGRCSILRPRSAAGL